MTERGGTAPTNYGLTIPLPPAKTVNPFQFAPYESKMFQLPPFCSFFGNFARSSLMLEDVMERGCLPGEGYNLIQNVCRLLHVLAVSLYHKQN